MNSPSRSDERAVGLDFDAPLPAAWAVAVALLAVHAGTSVWWWLAGHTDLLDALFLQRSMRFRVDAGGQYWPYVRRGESWRLWTSVLLHADALHLAFNGIGVVALGRLLEPMIGKIRYIAWFMVGGVGGSAVSHLVGIQQSDGASGGVYALLGVAVAFGWRFRRELPAEDRRLLGPILGAFLLINVVVSFAVPFIDAAGHMGGLAVGVVLAFAVGVRRHRAIRALEVAWIAASAVICAVGWALL